MNEVNVDQNIAAPTSDSAGDSIWEIARRNRTTLTVIGAIAIYLLCFAAYWTALRGDFIWDDDHYVSNNPMLRSTDGLPEIWNFNGWREAARGSKLVQYYPMTLTSFWIEYQIWGNNPAGYHVVNVFLHATTAFLLWIVL